MHLTFSISESLSTERPWPGLRPFTEHDAAFYFGRDAEIDKLSALIKRSPVCVMYGESGLGKTSLVQAGLFQRLMDNGYLPCLVRINHTDEAPSIPKQILNAVDVACKRYGVERPAELSGNSLWELVNQSDSEFWDRRNRPLIPWIIFDQFEEVFTLGQESLIARERIASFRQDLFDLVEARWPVHLQTEPDCVDRYAPDSHRYRLLFVLREDFLPHLDAWREHAPQLMHNRFRLERLEAQRAIEVVANSGREILAHGVADLIIGSLSSRLPGVPSSSSATIEPALLSLFCAELNTDRLEKSLSQITPELVIVHKEDFIRRFYDDAFGPVPPQARRWLETHLLTGSGYRCRVAKEDAISVGVSPNDIGHLVDRRLIHRETRDGVVWLELSHDVLIPVVRNSRDQCLMLERERSMRRKLVSISVLAAVLFLLVGIMAHLYSRANFAKSAERAALRSATAARERSEHLVAYIVTDLQAKLAGLGRSDLLADSVRAVQKYYDSMPAGLGTTRPADYLRTAASQARSDIERGRLATAAELLRTILKVEAAADLPAEPPSDLADDLATIWHLQAEVERRMGRMGPAWTSVQNALNLRRKSQMRYPSKWTNHMALARTLDEASAISRLQGRGDQALQLATESLSIRSNAIRLSASPEVATLDLARGLDQLGISQRSRGMRSQALSNFYTALLIRSNYCQKLGMTNSVPADLARSMELVGGELMAVGRLTTAAGYLNRALSFRRELVAGDPGNAVFQRELAACLRGDVGALLMQSNALASAPRIRESLDIVQSLVARDPDNMQWLHDLAITEDNLGDLDRIRGKNARPLAERDRYFGNAYSHYSQSLSIRQQLLSREPSCIDWERGMAIIYGRFGELYYDIGRVDLARTNYVESLQIRQKLVQKDPQNLFLKHDCYIASIKLGIAYEKSDLPECYRNYIAAANLAGELLTTNPTSWQWRLSYAEADYRLGHLLEKSPELDRSRHGVDLLQRSYATFRQIDVETGFTGAYAVWYRTLQNRFGNRR